MPTLALAIDATRARIGAAEFNKAINSATVKAKVFDRGASQLNTKLVALSATAQSTARRFVGLASGIAGIAGAVTAVRTVAQFEETLLTLRGVAVSTTQTLAVQTAQFQALEAAAREAGATTRFSAAQAADGLLFLARAGFDADEAIAALPSTLSLAVAGVLDLGEAADIASNVLKQFGLETFETARVANVLVRTANAANTDVRQLAEALKLAGPIAATAGLSLEETARAIGVLGDAGVQGSLAGTNLRGVLLGLAGPTSKAAKAFKRLGIDAADLNPEINTATEIFRRLKPALDALPDGTKLATLDDIFGRRNAAAASILADNVERLGEEFNETGRSADDLAKLQDSGLIGSFKALVSAAQELVLSLGREGGAGEAFKNFVDGATEMLRVLGGVSDATGKARRNAELLAIAIKTLGAVLFTGGVLKGFGALAGTVIRVQAAFVGATFAAQRFKIALAATGVGLLVVALGEVAAALLRYNDASDEAAAGSEQFSKASESEIALLQELGQELRTLRATRALGSDDDGSARDKLAALERELAVLEDLRVLAESGVNVPVDIPFNTAGLQTQLDRLRQEIAVTQFQASIELSIEADKANEAAAQAIVDERLAQIDEGIAGLGKLKTSLSEELAVNAALQTAIEGLNLSEGERVAVLDAVTIAQRAGIVLADEEIGRIAALAGEIDTLNAAEEARVKALREQAKATESLGDLETALTRQIALENELVGATDKERGIQLQLAEARLLAAKAGLDEGDERLVQIENQIRALAELQGEAKNSTKEAEALKATIQRSAEEFGQALGGALFDLADGSKELGDVLEDLTRLAVEQLTRIAVAAVLARAAGAPATPGAPTPGVTTTSAKGNVFPGGMSGTKKNFGLGGVASFGLAGGAIFDRTTRFGGSDGGQNIVAEAGSPEAVLPLERDARGRLGVSISDAAGGGSNGGGGVTVIQNIQTPDLDGFRRSRRQVERDARRGFESR